MDFLKRFPNKKEPELARNHDGNPVAHGLSLLHVMRGEDGSPLMVPERSTHGPPAEQTNRESFSQTEPECGDFRKPFTVFRGMFASHHIRCFDLGSIPDDGSSSRTI